MRLRRRWPAFKHEHARLAIDAPGLVREAAVDAVRVGDGMPGEDEPDNGSHTCFARGGIGGALRRGSIRRSRVRRLADKSSE